MNGTPVRDFVFFALCYASKVALDTPINNSMWSAFNEFKTTEDL